MRILCIGDSLGLPREGVTYEDTWFYKLQKYFSKHEFLEQFERKLHITKALDNFYSYYVFYPSDIIIIQLGICDCAPRYIIEEKLSTRIIQTIFYKLGLLKLFWKIVKLRKRSPHRVDTPIHIFSDNMNRLISNFINHGVKHIILVKIGHAAESVLNRNIYINENINKYNREIEHIKAKYPQKIVIVNPLEKIDENYYVDGYHCNAQGMDVVFSSLKTELENIIKSTLNNI